MTFKDWIKQFIDEGSERGELARIVWNDIHFPSTDRWVKAHYRLSFINNELDTFLTLNNVWQLYKSEHGDNIIYFDLIDSDSNTVFSEFIKEKEAYQFMFKLQRQGTKFNLISEAENAGMEEEDLFLIKIDKTFRSFYYNSLDEIVDELNKLKNIVHFPLGKVT